MSTEARHGSPIDRTDEWNDLQPVSRPSGERPCRVVVFITKLLCSDVEQTINFIKGFYFLTELFENRDYAGSTILLRHRQRQLLAFFDMPGLGLGDYQEVLGGIITLPFQ